MAKRIRFPVHQNNLDATLDALRDLPDDALSAWGKAYNWAVPVECRTQINEHACSVDPVSSVEVLLHRRDDRLNLLLLRHDMFALGSGHVNTTYGSLLYEFEEDKYHDLISEDALLQRGLLCALSLSDVQSASFMDQALRRPDHFTAMSWFYVNMTGERKKIGLFANSETRPSLEKAVAFCEERVVSDARVFRQQNRVPLVVFQSEHLWRWRHAMCVAALHLDHPVLFEIMHDAIGKACTKTLVHACLEHGKWEPLLALCEAARSKGWTDEGQWPVALVRNRAEFTSTPAAAVATALKQRVGKWKEAVGWALEGKFDVPGELDMTDRAIPAELATVVHDLNEALWKKMVRRFPVATMPELCQLMAACAEEKRWQERLLSLSSCAPSELSQDLSAWAQSKDLAQWKGGNWEDRMGQLLALAPQAWSTVAGCLGLHREKVAGHKRSFEQKNALENQTTTPSATRPRRSL